MIENKVSNTRNCLDLIDHKTLLICEIVNKIRKYKKLCNYVPDSLVNRIIYYRNRLIILRISFRFVSNMGQDFCPDALWVSCTVANFSFQNITQRLHNITHMM